MSDLYDASVPVFDAMLKNLSALLAKGAAHAAARGFDPAVLLNARLAPDMFPLVKQVQLSCDFAARAAARLAGQDPASFPDTETGFAELQGRIAAARGYIASFHDAAFDGWAGRSITLKVGGQDMTFTGDRFLLGYSLPQFHFHATTAYDILRHNGVEINKRDYLGAA